ncbi:B12-binding domain-containing radical SAM protein [bacterium 210820-DFI.6.37]|nr:B12-binding domain-containing radical SAM protein [bacterium 210820-DFI.6.37]
MKVLLTTLNSKYVHSNLALKYLYMAGRKHCGQLEIQEFTINNSRDYIFNELVMGGFDAVCFSVYIWNIEKTLQLAADLKKACPRTVILFGGPEVSYDCRAFMEQNPFVDFLIAGEGEDSFAKWCRALEGAGSFQDVEGLLFRKGDTVFAGPAPCPVDFSGLTQPYQEFPCEEDKVIYYEASRGCPFRCSYCISSLDRKVRELPRERVKADLDRFLHNTVKQVKFLDRTFNWDRGRSLELFRYLIERDNHVTNFHFEICGDLLDEETLELLGTARKGLFQFEIGIQSTNPRALAAVDRSGDTKKLRKNVRRLVEMGNSHIHTDLIAGLPFEDYASFRQSFNDVYELGADNLQLGFLKLLKGTKIRREAKRYGYVYMEKAPYQVISNMFISAEELCGLKRIEEVLDLYHNRGGFSSALSWATKQMARTPFDFYEAFADDYYAGGFQHKSHKKEDLYRILYQFGCRRGAGEKMKALLEADMEKTMNFDAVKKFKRKGWSIIL